MYERIDRHAARKPKRDLSLVPHVVLIIVLSVVLIVPIGCMCLTMYRFQCFKQDLAASMAHAEDAGILDRDRANRFFGTVVDAGMGKPQDAIPTWEPARIEFGDGSTLELWQVAIDGDSDTPGTFIRYTRADGDVFAYDTDRLDFQLLVDTLGIG